MAAIAGQPAPKPGSTPSPDLQQDALDHALAAMESAPQAAPAKSDALDSALAQGEAAPPAPPPEQPGIMRQGLDYALRGLDYAGGNARTALATGAGMVQNAVQGKNPLAQEITTGEDVKKALKGQAPTSAEYLRRLGVPEGGSLNVPGLGKVTIRGAAGLAADIATDPLTLVAKAVKGSPYLEKLFNSPGKASEALGEAVYKSALPEHAREAAPAIIEAGAPVGGTAKLAQKVQDMSNTMGKLRQGLYDRATELGVSVDTAYPLKRAEAVIAKMDRDPGLQPAAQELSDLLGRYKEMGKVPIDLVSEWKTNLYDSLPKSAWGNNGKLRGFAKEFKAALAGDFREAIIGAGNTAEKGLGDSIDALNNKWGTLLSATQPLAKASGQGGSKLGHLIDGAVLATGGIKGAAVKKGFDMATSPYAKTLVGKALMEAGRNGIASGLANRTLIDLNQPEPPPIPYRNPEQQ